MKPISPYLVPGLYAAYDMRLETGYADSDPISTLTDQSGNGYNLTSSGSNRPTCKTGIVNGHRVARFSSASSQYLAGASAADWAFLHDGTGSTVIDVVKFNTASGTQALWATGGYAGAQIGVDVYHNFSTGQTAGGGANGTTGIMSLLPKTSFTAGRWHCITRNFKYTASVGMEGATGTDAALYIDGMLGAHGAALASPSTSSPAYALQCGRMFDLSSVATFHFDGDLAARFIFRRCLDDDTLQAVWAWIEDTYKVYSATMLPNDRGYYEAQGTIVRNSRTGLFHISYERVNQHWAIPGCDLLVRDSVDGRNWSPARQVGTYTGTSLTGFTLGSPRLHMLSNGDCFMTVNEGTNLRWSGNTALVDSYGPAFYRSTDNLRTWGTRTAITGHGWNLYAVADSQMIEPDPSGAPGTLLLPLYGMSSGDPHWSVKLMRSTDYGATWSLYSTLANGATDSCDYLEVALIALTTTKLIAMVRTTTPGVDQATYFKSTNGGATWGSKTTMSTFNVMNVPKLIRMASGRLILLTRDDWQTRSAPQRPALYWSTDSATDYSNASTSWHGPFYTTPRDSFQLSEDAVEAESGVLLSVCWSSYTSRPAQTASPFNEACWGRTIRLKESEIALV